jgi:hypothetical protein
VRGHRGCYSLLTDEDLLSLVGAGDAFAFTALHDRHSRAIYSLARRLTGDEQDAEDLAQDGFLKVWRSADSYRAEIGGRRRRQKPRLRGRSLARPSPRPGANTDGIGCVKPSRISRTCSTRSSRSPTSATGRTRR